VKVGDAVTIQADIANTGNTGKVRAIIKIDGVQLLSQDNSSLVPLPAGSLWSVRTTYTMPNKNVTLTVEAYGWDGSNWTLNSTKTSVISMTTPGCSGVSLDPIGGAQLDPSSVTNNKVTITATVTPTGTSFPVMFIDGSGTVLGTCNTNASSGTCTYVFNSVNKAAGTYSIHAVSGIPGAVGACTSTSISIIVGTVVTQYTLTVAVNDANDGSAVSGASVLVTVAGTSVSLTKLTGADGKAAFLIDMGTASITVSKAGYNTYTTAEYVYYSKTYSVPFVPTPVVPTPGGIQFVSVPSNAAIYIDNAATSVGNTPLTVNGITAGLHSYVLKASGYNDATGVVTVLSGSVVAVYVSMPPVTPTKGSLNITSHPVMGAEIFVDNADMNRTTSGSALITDIPPGAHTYKLVLTGYKDSSGTFNISAGQTTVIDAALALLPNIGNVEISSIPSEAMVYIDNAYTNKNTPASVSNLGAGSHTYKLVLDGYKDATGTFSIIAGNVTPVDVTMVAIIATTGTLQITSAPSNAKVLIDGKDSNKITPAIIDGLSEGTHTYGLTLVGYKDAGAIVSIVAGQTKTVNVTLEQTGTTPTATGAGIGTIALAAGVVAVVMIKSKKSDKKEY
jgi:hypothetical protein